MNILVTGAGGQLGSEMRIVSAQSADRYFFSDICEMGEEQAALIRRLGGDNAVCSTIRLDITSREAISAFVQENDIKAIVNCAAFTNVEAAEDKQDLAELLNATAPGYLAEAMQLSGGTLFHVSTDYVFGADPYNTPCREDQTGRPTGVYGLTKLHGEQKIIASGCKHVIIRTAWLYSEFGKNFLKTMHSLSATKPALSVVFDQAGTPTYALDLARAIVAIIDSRSYEGNSGVYHYSNEGVCSWYDFTKYIALCAGHTACDIRPCHSDEYPSKVIRPAYSVLDKTKIKQTFGLEIPYWMDSVRDCIERL